MKKFFGIIACIACFSAYATPIKISSTALGGTLDNQVSAGCETGNQWDLESTLLDGSQLSIVSSFNLKDGQFASGWGKTFTSGDIFIDIKGINGDAKNASNPAVGDLTYSTFSNSLVNYDYVFHLDFSNSSPTYTVFKLNALSVLSNVYWDNYNSQANPLAYVSGGTQVGGTYSLTYQINLADNAALGYTSWGSPTKHNEVTVDLANLGLTGVHQFTSHFTIGCGNDVAVGKGTYSVPEPGSLSMILIGLLSLMGFAVSRKRK
jgi:hypothetical protein